jgi:thioredoxin-related protein
MRIIIYLGIAFLLMSNASNESIRWYTMQEAIDLQKTAPRKIVVDVYTTWCGWCTKMDNTTFSRANVAAYMNKNFYPVKFNAEGNDTIRFKGRTWVNANYKKGGKRSTHSFTPVLVNGRISYPVFIFLSEKTIGITKAYGYQPHDKWMAWLRYIAKDKYKKYPRFEQYYDAEEKE